MIRVGLALFFAALCTVATAADVAPRTNEVELQADASREVQNDLMSATVYAEVNDTNPAQLAQTLNRTVNEALRTARAVDGVVVKSRGNQTYPVYDRNNRITGWRGRSELRLESKDFEALGALIGKLQATMQLGGVSFVVSPELRRTSENELIADAIAAFRARAEIVRTALGAGALKIRKLNVGTSGSAPPPRVFAARAQPMASASEVAPSFEGGTSQVQVSVSGSIELE